jgi:phosphinothricin acetyltransferase
MKIKIRNAIFDDLESLNRIYNQAINDGLKTADTENVTIDNRKEWMQEHLSEFYPILVAEIDSKIVGYLSISPYRKGRKALSKTVEISYYVDYEFHNLGLGKALLSEGIFICKKNGMKDIFAIIIDSNIQSQKLLEKFGFEKWAFLPNILEYEEKEYSHIYMGKRI